MKQVKIVVITTSNKQNNRWKKCTENIASGRVTTKRKYKIM